MKSLEHPDSLHLRAAQGWLELGDYLEADEELERISPPLRVHPDVLLLRYEVYAKAEKWEGAFRLTSALVDIVPHEPYGWINQSFALRKMPSRGSKAAWDALLPVAVNFPDNPIIPYKLACYACQLGQLKDARAWLSLSFLLYNELKPMALDEPDLEPLWLEIGKM